MRCRVATITRSSTAGTRKVNPLTRLGDAARDESLGHGRLLAGLSQSLGMHFYRFGKAGNDKVPLVRQAIAPTARLGVRAQPAEHHPIHAALIAVV